MPAINVIMYKYGMLRTRDTRYRAIYTRKNTNIESVVFKSTKH
jgi:hypothetical protein